MPLEGIIRKKPHRVVRHDLDRVWCHPLVQPSHPFRAHDGSKGVDDLKRVKHEVQCVRDDVTG